MKPDWFDEDSARINEWGERIKKSEAYPAILGAIAGGIAGALMAAIIAGLLAPKRSASNNSAEPAPPAAVKARGGWSPREVIEIISIGAALAKQVREWILEREKK